MAPNDGYRCSRSPGQAAGPLTEMPSISPVHGGVLGWYPVVRAEAVPHRAAEIRGRAGDWASRPVRERVAAVRRLRRMLADRAEEVVGLLAEEIGRPVVEAYGAELLPTLDSLRWIEQNAGRVLAPRAAQRFPSRRTHYWRPYGVVGLISAWNYPVFLSLPSIAAAHVAGNAVAWKPSELALGVSHLLYGLLEQAGLAEQVAFCPGDAAVGEALVEAACDKYVFIGSTETGRRLLRRLGELARPAVAELSGCDPMIVCPDADVETAARTAVWGRMTGAGQTCMAPKRVYVHRNVYPRFLETACECVRALRVGDPGDPSTEVGPLRTEEAREEAARVLDASIESGAVLLAGGRVPDLRGFYLQPTLLADCTDDMPVFREDLFAPVLAVAPVAGVDAAVARARLRGGGLTASVWTRDLRRARAMAEELPGGVATINDVILPAAAGSVPFGGSGASGYGRVRGEAGLLEMVQSQVVDEGPAGWWPRRHLFPYQRGTEGILRALTRLAGGDRSYGAAADWVRAVRHYGRR